jgi:hypothetical protein
MLPASIITRLSWGGLPPDGPVPLHPAQPLTAAAVHVIFHHWMAWNLRRYLAGLLDARPVLTTAAGLGVYCGSHGDDRAGCWADGWPGAGGRPPGGRAHPHRPCPRQHRRQDAKPQHDALTEDYRLLSPGRETGRVDVADLDDDPLRQLSAWLDAARAAGQPMPEAVTIATATGDVVPSARLVVLRGLRRGWPSSPTAAATRVPSWRPIRGRRPSCTGLFRRIARSAWRGRLSR